MFASTRTSRRRRSTLAGMLTVALLSANLIALVGSNVSPTAAVADTAPADPSTPTTVTAAALPTVQINGVVWAQVIVGNKVFATGEFTSARPAGSALGVNETPRSNILAYDITTGALITSWAPTLNAQARAITASADGSTIYVAGDFDKVNGVTRRSIAAIDSTTGALTSFNPGADSRVAAMALAGNTLYFGGYFTTVAGQARTRLAAVDATTGALLPWAPTADREILSMVFHPGTGRVIVGGNFNLLNGVTQLGMGSLDGVTAEVRPWAANTVIQNHDGSSAISSLVTDGDKIYGTGWAYFGGGATANFEGVFAADPTTGVIDWIDGGRGDNYGIAVTGDVVYTVGHPHDWGMLDWNPQSNPLSYQRTMAINKYKSPTLTNAYGTSDIWQPFMGRAAAQPLHWMPTLSAGTYTGQTQGAWSVATNGDYVVEGGEFPKVNGVAQQGLVRFARKGISPLGDPPQGYPEATPVLTGQGPGTVRVAWKAAWDRDNANLKVEVLRGATEAGSAVLKTMTTNTTWWNRPQLGFTDSTAPPGSSQTYRIRVTDPTGNKFTTLPTTITVPAGAPTPSPYSDSVLSDNPAWQWRLGEASGTTAFDHSNANDVTLDAANTRNAAGALLNEADPAVTFPGSSNNSTVQGVSSYWQGGPQTFSLEAWFNTTSTTGGKIIGFGNSNAGRSSTEGNDRQIYMNNAGQLYFGVRPDMAARLTVNSSASFRDGQWHHVVGTLSGDGLKLYVDGNLVASNAAVTKAQVYRGYWRIGGDQLGGWPSAPTREAFTGSIDEVAVYPSALSLGRIRTHYLASGRSTVFPNINPIASFTSTHQYLTATLTSTSTDDDGAIASTTWDFGDSTAGSGSTTQHTYAHGGTYPVTVTVTDNRGGTSTVTNNVTVEDPPPNVLPTASFNASALFHTASLTSTSTDSDGTIVTSAWTFGDGTQGTGPTVQHTYSQAGTYNVTLAVTDDRGDTVTTNKNVVVTELYDQDGFGRTVANGLGTADNGGAWTLSGTAASFSVGSGAGRIAGALNATNSAFLTAVRQTNIDTKVDVALNLAATGGGAYAYVINRRVSNGNDYRFKLRYVAGGTLQGILSRTVGSTETALSTVTVPGLTVAPGDQLRVRFQTIGTSPTTLRAKVWRQSTSEPTAWLMTTTDSTAALAAAGDIGVSLYTSSTWTGTTPALSVDNLQAGPDTGSPANVGPTASFDSSVAGRTATFTSTSTDSDGTISASLWDFGDGTTGTGPVNQHPYTDPGTYPVTLTVTDNSGATNTASGSVVITNATPTASFTSTVSDLKADFTSTSTDPDGTIVNYVWDFGDGPAGSGATPTHVYPTGGTYPVTLTVTDNNGGTNATINGSVTVTDPPPNIPPTASFTSSVAGRTATITSTSTDVDGTIVSYVWNFGDTTSGTGASNQHPYTNPGVYPVSLTVTDDDGDTATTGANITITNANPVASFTSTTSDLTASFTSTSSDSDGTIASTAWTFGDTTSGTGSTPSHTYSAGGTYPISVTVTDNDGATNTTNGTVTVTNLYDSDSFGRTAANGLGTADLGGAWTVVGTASTFSVNGSVGQIVGAVNTTRAGYLQSVRQTNIDTKADVALSNAATGGGAYVSVLNRRVSNGNDYQLKLRYLAGGSVSAFISRTVGNTATTLSTLTVPNLIVAPGDVLRVRFQVLGTNPTTLKAKVWRANAAEPTSWLLTSTDSTAALQTAGDVGVTLYLSSSWTGTVPTLSLDNLRAGPDAGTTGNTNPIAAFTSSVSNKTATFTSTAVDPDGTIASYLWNFGDNTSSTSVNPVHTYSSPGTYPVTLTVTDDGGATNTSAPTNVTIANVLPTASFTSTTSFLTANFTSTSTDSDGTIVSYLWDFGEGPAGSGATPSHTYSTGGTYPVTLTVTDNSGGTNTTAITNVTVVDPPPNVLPTAGFTFTTSNHTANFTSTSTDSDGTIVGYAWDFGDSTSSTSASPSHLYSHAGTFPVTLTVTDNRGGTNTFGDSVTIVNVVPTASFTSTVNNLTANFTSTSTDVDGTIVTYDWDFGDGPHGSGATTSHVYPTGGTYPVTLTVTDNDGDVTSTTGGSVTVTDPPPNNPPTAAFGSSVALRQASFTSTSTDSDGSIVSSSWDFGDLTSGSGTAPQHTYANPGTYIVVLTVTDNVGAQTSVSHPVTIVNALPTASFTSSVANLAATLTSTSTDVDGTIVSTSWNFGDATAAGTGTSVVHTYAVSGTYTVTLTVTDNNGGTKSTSANVTVTSAYATDTFTRTVANGLGTTTPGGAWSLVGTAASFSVNGTVGRIAGIVGGTNAAYLTAVRQLNTETKVDLALNIAATGGGTYVSVVGRRISNGNDYRVKLRYVAGGTITAYLSRTIGNAETTLASVTIPSLTVAPGDVLRVRLQVTGTGPTTIRAKVWRATVTEPTAWLLSTTDTTAALQAAGDVGILHYVSGSWTGTAPIVSVDNLNVTPPGP
jgi:PKD repeat protein